MAHAARSEQSKNLLSIVDRVRPAVEPLLSTGLDRAALAREAVRANVRASVEQLRKGSGVVEHMIAHDGVRVVGAVYDLESGQVEFFDEA